MGDLGQVRTPKLSEVQEIISTSLCHTHHSRQSSKVNSERLEVLPEAIQLVTNVLKLRLSDKELRRQKAQGRATVKGWAVIGRGSICASLEGKAPFPH